MRHACILVLALPVSLWAQDQPREDTQRILRDGGYQVTPPQRRVHEDAATGDQEAATRRKFGSRRDAFVAPRRDVPRPDFRSGTESAWDFGALVKSLGLAAVVVVLGLVIFFALRGRTQRRTKAPPAQAREGVVPARPLADYDALANDGRFDEAIHALFVAAVSQLEAHRGRRYAEAVTGREILRDCPPESRPALRTLAWWEERTIFAGVSADAEGFAIARSALDDLRGAI